MPLELPRFQRISVIATNDDSFRLVHVDKWFAYVDIFCYDNPCYLGDGTGQDILLLTDDIYEIPYPVNLSDLFAKNYTSGSNTRLVLAGLELSENQFKRLLEGGIFALR